MLPESSVLSKDIQNSIQLGLVQSLKGVYPHFINHLSNKGETETPWMELQSITKQMHTQTHINLNSLQLT